jgi:hypothetical protein
MNTSIDEILNLTSPYTGDPNKILSLGKTFNRIAGSSRPLIADFYDCGTNARAIFMHLIQLHRHNSKGAPMLTKAEKEAIRENFQPQYPNSNIDTLNDAIDTLRYMSDGVMILTVRFYLPAEVIATADPHPMATGPEALARGSPQPMVVGPNYVLNNPQFGHVWIIEKKNNQYYIYQSSLNEYTIPDFYAEKGVLLHNPKAFLNHLKPLLTSKYWTQEHNEIFYRCFHFVPRNISNLSPVLIKPEFFYAFVEY